MSKHRLINCEFINASSFKVSISNRAKLLYLMMFTSADDRGFVDTTNDLINTLTNNDKEFDKGISLELVENTYDTALIELLDRGYIYEFIDKHHNKIYLIRHWFLHNKLIRGLWTNYRGFLENVYLEDNEYKLGKKPLKEDKLKENNINHNKLNQNNIDDEEWNELMKKIEEPEQDSDDSSNDSLPF